MAQQLDRREESVHVEVRDAAGQGRGGHAPIVARPARQLEPIQPIASGMRRRPKLPAPALQRPVIGVAQCGQLPSGVSR